MYVLVAQNTFLDNIDEGVNIYGAERGTYLVANNAIALGNDGNEPSGGVQGGGDEPVPMSFVVRNNVIAQTTTSGIYLQEEDFPLQVINNTLFKTGSGFDHGGVDVNDIGFSHVFVENTILSAAAGFNLGNPDLTMRGHYTLADQHGAVEGVGNLFADPVFAFAGTIRDIDDRYRLSAGSPAINAGNPDTRYDDLDGSRNDLGAFGGPDRARRAGPSPCHRDTDPCRVRRAARPGAPCGPRSRALWVDSSGSGPTSRNSPDCARRENGRPA